MSTHARGYLSVTLAATLWGIAGTVAKYLFATRAIPPLLLVQIRLGLGSLLLLLVLRFFAPRLLQVSRSDFSFFAIWGILGMAGVQVTYLVAISETNVATAIFLQYLSPILTALYTWLFQGQKPGKLLLSCLAVATLGLFLLISGGSGQLLVSPLGLLSGVASAFFLTFYTIYSTRGLTRYSPWTVMAYGLGAGALFGLALDPLLLATGALQGGTQYFTSMPLWLFYIYIAGLSTALPFGLYLTGLKWITPTQANLTGMLEPVVGGLAAYLFLGESLGPVQLLGGALIVAAVLLLQSRRSPAETAPQA